MRKPNLPASRRVIAMRDRRNKIPLTGPDNVMGRTGPINMSSYASIGGSRVRLSIHNALMGRTHA